MKYFFGKLDSKNLVKVGDKNRQFNLEFGLVDKFHHLGMLAFFWNLGQFFKKRMNLENHTLCTK